MKFSPIAAFNDHEGIVCSVNFFSMPVTNKPGEQHRRGVVSAADDGTIMVYFEDDYSNYWFCCKLVLNYFKSK